MPRVDMLGDEARAPNPRLLRARVGALVDGAEPRCVDVGVALGRHQGGVAQHFLDGTQVGSTLEEVGGRRVTQPVGRNVVHAGLRGHSMDHGANDARINAPASVAEEERAAAGLPSQLGSASYEPVIERVLSRRTIGNDALLVTFAEDTHGQCLSIE